MRARDLRTLAAALASRPSNQRPNRLRPRVVYVFSELGRADMGTLLLQ